MPGSLRCPHCNSPAIPAWERYARPHRLRCRSCGELSRVGPQVNSLAGLLVRALVVFPVGLTLFVLTAVALRVHAPQLFWPFLAAVIVALVFVSGTGVPRPCRTNVNAGRVGIRGAVDLLRAAGLRMLGVILLMALGLSIFGGLAHLLAPYLR